MKSQKKVGLLIVFIWYCLCVFVVTPIFVKYLFSTDNVMTELFAELMSVGIPVTFLAMRKKRGTKESLYSIDQRSLKTIGYKNTFTVIGLSVAFSCMIQYTINAFQIMYIIKTNHYSIVKLLPETNIQTVILSVLVYALLPSVYEEILYRGLYTDAFATERTFVLYLVSSIVFASLHSNYISILNAFVLGILLMIIYQKFRTLYAVVIFHFINNLLALVFTNYISLPFSALGVLTDYANRAQMWAAVAVSFGIAAFMLMAVILCLENIFKEKGLVSIHRMKDTSRCVRILDYVITILLLVLAVGMIFLKLF